MDFDLKSILELGSFPFLIWVLYYILTKRVPEMERLFKEESKAARDIFQQELHLERELFSLQFRAQLESTEPELKAISAKVEVLTRAVRRLSSIIMFHDATTSHTPKPTTPELQALFDVVSGIGDEVK